MPKLIEGPCVCTALRRAARLVSIFYDELLASSGVTLSQYTLLAHIGRQKSLSRTELAFQMGVERTTLTRNLDPLERAGLIASAPGEDRREKLLSLTETGRNKVDATRPHWIDAQRKMVRHLGKRRWKHLHQLLELSGGIASQT
jgi:DNA-binding MarR family transcriptional regulator